MSTHECTDKSALCCVISSKLFALSPRRVCSFHVCAGFFARALENNQHNFAALTNIVYCNQKLYKWQDHNHFMALIEQAHEVYDQLLHPFHAAAYRVTGERFKVHHRCKTVAGDDALPTHHVPCQDLAVSYATNTLALVHPKFRLSHRDQNETISSDRVRCVLLEGHPARTSSLRNCLGCAQTWLHLDRPETQPFPRLTAPDHEEAQQARLRGLLSGSRQGAVLKSLYAYSHCQIITDCVVGQRVC